jgi:DNA-binding PucR family transcriptional regulator
VALIASALQDDLLATSLRNLYLVPLSEEKDKGKILKETLRAYLSSERNISSTAAALGVSRRTVANRLHTIETRLARPLSATLPGVEAALYLEKFEILA